MTKAKIQTQYLLFSCSSGYTKALQYYVIRTLPLLFFILLVIVYFTFAERDCSAVGGREPVTFGKEAVS